MIIQEIYYFIFDSKIILSLLGLNLYFWIGFFLLKEIKFIKKLIPFLFVSFILFLLIPINFYQLDFDDINNYFVLKNLNNVNFHQYESRTRIISFFYPFTFFNLNIKPEILFYLSFVLSYVFLVLNLKQENNLNSVKNNSESNFLYFIINIIPFSSFYLFFYAKSTQVEFIAVFLFWFGIYLINYIMNIVFQNKIKEIQFKKNEKGSNKEKIFYIIKNKYLIKISLILSLFFVSFLLSTTKEEFYFLNLFFIIYTLIKIYEDKVFKIKNNKRKDKSKIAKLNLNYFYLLSVLLFNSILGFNDFIATVFFRAKTGLNMHFSLNKLGIIFYFVNFLFLLIVLIVLIKILKSDLSKEEKLLSILSVFFIFIFFITYFTALNKGQILNVLRYRILIVFFSFFLLICLVKNKKVKTEKKKFFLIFFILFYLFLSCNFIFFEVNSKNKYDFLNEITNKYKNQSFIYFDMFGINLKDYFIIYNKSKGFSINQVINNESKELFNFFKDCYNIEDYLVKEGRTKEKNLNIKECLNLSKMAKEYKDLKEQYNSINKEYIFIQKKKIKFLEFKSEFKKRSFIFINPIKNHCFFKNCSFIKREYYFYLFKVHS